jgi:hypothetical protein
VSGLGLLSEQSLQVSKSVQLRRIRTMSMGVALTGHAVLYKLAREIESARTKFAMLVPGVA